MFSSLMSLDLICDIQMRSPIVVQKDVKTGIYPSWLQLSRMVVVKTIINLFLEHDSVYCTPMTSLF